MNRARQKNGPQVSRIVQARPGRSGKQQQEQNSRNLGTGFFCRALYTNFVLQNSVPEEGYKIAPGTMMPIKQNRETLTDLKNSRKTPLPSSLFHFTPFCFVTFIFRTFPCLPQSLCDHNCCAHAASGQAMLTTHSSHRGRLEARGLRSKPVNSNLS